ncbi:MAG: hypothetical protein Q9211_004524, partial [Gyalolechia sp. 1 TL-2023]
RGAEAERHGSREDEAVAPGEGDGGDDADAGDGDGGEEEGGHAAEDGAGDRDEGGGEFGEDAHDEEEEAARVARFAVGAAGQGDDAVVLGEGAERGDGQEAGEEAVEAVGEDAALDAGIKEFAFDFEAGDIAGRGDVADGFHHEDNPTRRPRTTEHDFMIGEPKRSQMMIVTKTEKPRPINSALPQGRAWGPPTDGQIDSAVGLDPSRTKHEPLPPAQLAKPDSIRDIPIKVTVGPVTRGGKNFFNMFGLMKESRISSNAQTVPVPIKAP